MTLTVEQRVQNSIASILMLAIQDIAPEKSLLDLDCDSLDMVEIIMSLEEEFECKVDEAEAMKCKTVADLIALITKMHDPAAESEGGAA